MAPCRVEEKHTGRGKTKKPDPLASYETTSLFYSKNHAGPAIDSESDGAENRGKKRRNLVLYGKDIKEFMKER